MDFFVRIVNVLNLSNEEKDVLVRWWAFGVERWRYLLTPAQSLATRESESSRAASGLLGEVR
jgi:hypothetical protein